MDAIRYSHECLDKATVSLYWAKVSGNMGLVNQMEGEITSILKHIERERKP